MKRMITRQVTSRTRKIGKPSTSNAAGRTKYVSVVTISTIRAVGRIAVNANDQPHADQGRHDAQPDRDKSLGNVELDFGGLAALIEVVEVADHRPGEGHDGDRDGDEHQ